MSFDVPAIPAEIVKVGHPALRNGTRSVPQELFGTAALHELIEVMRATLAGKGVGLAAPQIAVAITPFRYRRYSRADGPSDSRAAKG